MSFFCRLSRRHYWCVPHRSSDNRLVQVCYECGAERTAREVMDDFAAERFNHSLATAKAQASRLAQADFEEMPGQARRVGAGGIEHSSARRFLLIK